MLRCGAANASFMSITREEVAKIASLARIRMDDAELDRMVPELNNILGWVEQLGEVDTSQVEPMTAVIPQAMRLRDDMVDADPARGYPRQCAGGRARLFRRAQGDRVTSAPHLPSPLTLSLSKGCSSFLCRADRKYGASTSSARAEF